MVGRRRRPAEPFVLVLLLQRVHDLASHTPKNVLNASQADSRLWLGQWWCFGCIANLPELVLDTQLVNELQLRMYLLRNQR